ncbi:MAG: DUF262 domain-containing protein [Pseudomonadota bacterium]
MLSRPVGVAEGEFHVVDGQQRLTTLVIFLRMLSDYLPTVDQAAFKSLYLRRGELGSDRSVLRLNSDTRLFLERVVMGDGNAANEPATLEAHARLLKARQLIQIWLHDRLKAGVSTQIIRTAVETELGFLVYAPEEDAETGIMFEVINNRGKPLSELEKVKNYLIYCCVKLQATTLRDTIDVDWSDILRKLNTAKKTSTADEGAFLRYCVAVHFKLNKTDSQYGYDELKKRMRIDAAVKDPHLKREAIKGIDDFVSFMKTAALWYARLYGQQHDGLDANLRPILDQIRAQERHASIMPIFLALVIKLEGCGERLLSLLNLLEILNFRVYMARNMTARNDTGQGDLYYFASRYYHSELLSDFSDEDKKIGHEVIEDEEAALEYRLVEFISWNAPDTLFRESFLLQAESPDDFYKWGGLRYFLMNYEAELQPNKTIQIDKITLSRSEGKSADYLSVEHLWALENRNRAGENDRKIDRFEKRRLGNFVLLELRLNIQGQNDGVADKYPRYLKGFDDEPPTDLEQVRKMARNAKDILKEMAECTRSKNYYLELHRKLNTGQEKRFVTFAESRWSIKNCLGYKKLQKEALAEASEGEL